MYMSAATSAPTPQQNLGFRVMLRAAQEYYSGGGASRR